MQILKKKFFLYIPYYLIILLPLFIITGPFLADLALSVSALIFLVYCIKIKNFKYFNNKFVIFFFSFYLYLILNSFISYDIFRSLEKSVFYFRFALFSLCFWYLLDVDKKILFHLLKVIFLCYFILNVDGYFQFFFKKNLFGHPLYQEDLIRVSSFFNDELVLGSYLTRFLPLFCGLIFLLWNTIDKRLKILFFILNTSTLVIIFLSGERAAFFLAILSYVFMILLFKKNKMMIVSSLLVSLFLILIIFKLDPDSGRVIQRTIEESGLSKITGIRFTKGHDEIYQSAINIFKDNPIFGSGLRTYNLLCNKEIYKVSSTSCTTHPHNTYIQLLSETGLVGFFFIFFVFILIIYYCIKHLILLFKKKYLLSDFQICLFACFLITLWPITSTGNFFNNWLNCIYFYPVGIYLHTISNRKLKY